MRAVLPSSSLPVGFGLGGVGGVGGSGGGGSSANVNPLQHFADATSRVRRRAAVQLAKSACAVALVVVVLAWAWFRTVWSGWRVRDACMVLEQTLPMPTAATAAATPKLPKITHQSWKNDKVPPHLQAWREQMMRVFRAEDGFEHMLWNDETQRNLIKEKYPWFLETYDGYEFGIVRADAARPFILHAYGGLYLDLDYEVLENFWDRLPSDRPAIIEAYAVMHELHQNSLMSSPKDHEFWRVTWDVMQERAKSGSRVVELAGPGMVDEAIRRFGADKVVTLPCENFHRVPLGDESKHTKWYNYFDRALWYYSGLARSCGRTKVDACELGIHHSTVSWNSRR